jgi:thiol-disulfide isomerase/thioredoxin
MIINALRILFWRYLQVGYFDGNSQWGAQGALQSKSVEPAKKKSVSYLPLVMPLAIIVLLAGTVYLFWPSIKGCDLMEKAAKLVSGGVSLTGIAYAENAAPMAIVNGQVVHEGEMVGEVKVVKIHKDGVEFETAKKKWTQNMPSSEEGVCSGAKGKRAAIPVLLELGSSGCPACRQMEPIIKELKSTYSKKFRVDYIDVWANPAEGQKYGVTAIPTQIFYNASGKEVFRHVGYYTKDEILAAWGNAGIKL